MITKEIYHGQTTYHITSSDLSVWLNPEDGMNLYEIIYHDQTVVRFYEDRLRSGKTCSVMTLFPTPNRIRDNRYTYEGTSHNGWNHGICRHAPFIVTSVIETEYGGSISAELELSENGPASDLYKEAYPFCCILKLTIEVNRFDIIYRYEVTNTDTKRLPYGIAIHPFFEKLSDSVSISVNTNTRMEHDCDRLPTGTLLNTSDTYDIHDHRPVKELALDDVYLVSSISPAATIHYDSFEISLHTSKEFEKLVVFTPKDSPFFCLENQTCSTDAINLFTKGYKKEASLLTLAPKESNHGWIRMEFRE